MGHSGDTDNLGKILNNSHCKIPDNHSSGYKIYFPIGYVLTSITGKGFPTLVTRCDIVAFYSIICLILYSVT